MPGSDAIDIASAVVLGAVQGVTEFLPVSSSGHIALGALFFGLEDAPLTLSIVLHAGTLIATLVLLGSDVKTLFVDSVRGLKAPTDFAQTDSGKTVLAVIVATLPTVALGLGLRDHVESWQHVPWIVGVCLLGSAVMVATTRSGAQRDLDPKRRGTTSLGLKAAFVVGVSQGLAVLPGLSRSGTTIAVAMLLGMSGPAAFRFSFLLSLPAVAGAVVLELVRPGAFESVPPAVWAGGAVAIVVGIASLLVLRKLVDQGRFWAFAFYLVPVGAGVIVWDVFLRST